MRIACIIPARLKSTRFPQKMLAPLFGKPLIQWVWESALSVPLFSEVAIAVDSTEVAEVVTGFGGRAFMTNAACLSGTDRLVEVRMQKKVHADVWVNWQGDEPFVNEQMIQDLLQTCSRNDADVWTLKKKILKPEEITSTHIAKVVCNAKGEALYFSRAPIPHYRNVSDKEYYKHVGLYAFSDAALQKISSLEPCALEQAEQLEQLRFLYHGLKIKVHETFEEPFGIDLPEHLSVAEKRLSSIISS